MRIAVISDMHGNDFGFDVAVADIERAGVDQMVCLGDAIQGGPQPAETVQRLRSLNCPVVMGNADHWMLTGDEKDEESAATQKMLDIRDWSLSQLNQDDRAFISGFQPTVTIDLGDGKKLVCFHGSPHSFNHIILPTTPDEEFKGYLAGFAALAYTGGHTHMQQVRRLGDNFFFNPGSVGFAYSHQQPENDFRADPWAEYAILTYENGRISLDFRRLPYDAQTMRQIYLDSGRPYAADAAAQYNPR
jgi:predicted phosphodiesterase